MNEIRVLGVRRMEERIKVRIMETSLRMEGMSTFF